MMTFLCWYFGISVAYTIILYLTLSSDKVFCLLLENGKDTHFNAYLNLRSAFLYLPITLFILNVLVFPLNFVSRMLSVTLQIIEKSFVKVVGGQEEKFRLKASYRLKAKYRLKSKYNINSRGGDDNK